MGCDPDNPFASWLQPGSKVVIKPNWVIDFNPTGHGLECTITHPSLVAYLAELCAKAMEGQGTVIIGDCPIQGCDFEALQGKAQVREWLSQVTRGCPQLELRVEDWRLTMLRGYRQGGHSAWREAQKVTDAAPEVMVKYDLVDLGKESFLEDLADYSDRFRVTMYKASLMLAHHSLSRHEYLIRRDVLEAALLINVGKLKTHAKAGLTGALKNLIGINGHKEYLPHHVQGAFFDGGDAYCHSHPIHRLADRLYDNYWEKQSDLSLVERFLRFHLLRAVTKLGQAAGGDRIRPGSWPGNETLWRTTLDLNHLVYFGSKRPVRVLNVVDGVVAGEGDGPLRPMAKPLGLLLVGENPAYIDAVIAKLIGYNLARVPTVHNSLFDRRSGFGGAPLDAPIVHQLQGASKAQIVSVAEVPSRCLRPPPYWRRAVSQSRAHKSVSA
jgi:uncharacterized protein (DUF362 family)